MKRYLLISIMIMVVTVLFMAVSDQLFHTSYTGVTHFQPFPHLLLLLSCAASFYFGYRVRTDGCSADKINWVNRVFNRLLRHISECFLLVAIALVCMKLMGLDV